MKGLSAVNVFNIFAKSLPKLAADSIQFNSIHVCSRWKKTRMALLSLKSPLPIRTLDSLDLCLCQHENNSLLTTLCYDHFISKINFIFSPNKLCVLWKQTHRFRAYSKLISKCRSYNEMKWNENEPHMKIMNLMIRTRFIIYY